MVRKNVGRPRKEGTTSKIAKIPKATYRNAQPRIRRPGRKIDEAIAYEFRERKLVKFL